MMGRELGSSTPLHKNLPHQAQAKYIVWGLRRSLLDMSLALAFPGLATLLSWCLTKFFWSCQSMWGVWQATKDGGCISWGDWYGGPRMHWHSEVEWTTREAAGEHTVMSWLWSELYFINWETESELRGGTSPTSSHKICDKIEPWLKSRCSFSVFYHDFKLLDIQK